jgi:hypothetical protein
VIYSDIVNMEGYTMTEMANLLSVSVKTINMRLFRAGIKPMTKDALYDPSALEAIRNVPGKGRPPKAKPEPAKKAKK